MREKGFLILDQKIKNMNKEKKNGTSYGCWVQYQGEEYYFKTGTEYENYMELFCEEIAKVLKIPTATYDLAKLNGMIGVISKNINPQRLKETTLEEIINEYYEKVILKNPNLFPNEIFIENAFNLEDVWWALEYYYRNWLHKENIVKELMKQIVDSFILQILTFNSDLNYQNLIILEGKIPTLAANFDYGKGGLVNFDVPKYNYFFSVVPFDIKESKAAKDIIKDFINLSDDTLIEKLKSYVLKLNENAINKILKQIELKTNYSIPEKIKDYLYNGYYEKIYTIQNIIDEKNNNQKR